ncbi:MAG: TolC family protein [Bacteroidales bacterium]|nr:TolC family protein [Bacteroidales bacterium]
MEIKKFIIAVAFFVAMFMTFKGIAQQSEYISEHDAVARAISNNSNIKMADMDVGIANADYHRTDAAFLPQLTLNYTAMSTNNPLNAFGFLLQHRVVSGTDFDPERLNNPHVSQDYIASAELKMPVLNMDMIYARKGARAQETMYKYKKQRSIEYVEFEVRKTYSFLQFSYRAREVLIKSLSDVKSIYESVNNFYRQGLIQKSDLLNARVQMNVVETELAKAESNIKNASDGLRVLMGLDINGEIFSADTLEQRQSVKADYYVPEKRADLMALNKAVEASSFMVSSSKMAFMPHVNAFGSYQFNDAKALKFGSDSYLIGINLSWNVFSGNKNRSKTKSYKYQHNKMSEKYNYMKRQSSMELLKTERELNDSQLEIDKRQASVVQAGESLRITRNRFDKGLASTTDLLAAQARLSQQELQLAGAVMQYNITQSYLKFITEVK